MAGGQRGTVPFGGINGEFAAMDTIHIFGKEIRDERIKIVVPLFVIRAGVNITAWTGAEGVCINGEQAGSGAEVIIFDKLRRKFKEYHGIQFIGIGGDDQRRDAYDHCGA